LRLALFTGEARYRELAEQILRLTLNDVQRMPNGFGHMLCALDFYLSEAREIALVGSWADPGIAEMIATVFQRYLPSKVVALALPEDATAGQTIPLLAQRTQVEGKATAYVCQNFVCAAPVTTVAELEALLE
jgi:uncharacterized protein